MYDRRRQLTIIYLALAILGMFILAASLSNLVFEPGVAIPGAVEQPSSSASGNLAPAQNNTAIPWLLQGLLGIGLVFLFLVFLVVLYKKASKKRIGMAAAALAVLAGLLLLLPRIHLKQPTGAVEAPTDLLPAATAFITAPIGDPPRILTWLIITALALAAAGIAIWLLLMADRHSRKEDQLALEAAAALQAIAEGENIQNVIIRCYLQMEQVMRRERGIERKQAVTPREFEQHLIKRGIPNAPVHQLTRLFESARYGDQRFEAEIEQEAVACLSAVRASLSVKEGNR